MGHTEQAAKYARRCCFAMLDYFGLNSLFLSTTPDDECSFRVRLYCKPQYWVRPTIYSKMEFFVLFLVCSMWYACCFVIRFFYWCLINIIQNRIFCFLLQGNTAVLTWTSIFSAWTSRLEVFRRGLPCWFCVAKRHKDKISRCLFIGISKYHANIDEMHA